jgi:leukotriene-A4 hydrolase
VRQLTLALAGLGVTILAGAALPSSEALKASGRSGPSMTRRDQHSFADPAQARVTHVALDLTADFDAHVFSGTATLTLEAAPTATQVLLDTNGLTILSATDAEHRPLTFELGPADPILGRWLQVALPADRRTVVVRYRTSPGAAALQWLRPLQTAGRKAPYVFSQGEAILTRSWVPTQDSPGIRQTYQARIVVPAALHAVMSADQLTPDGELLPGGQERAFLFRLDKPIPPYLIAIAVGDIAFKPVGSRSGVYAEPSVVDKAAWEFADVEKMIEAAESIGGEYDWGRYDVLVMPPSFPFGGMENPRLTFATPTVIAGDRSLTSLVAHELAHSWSGNLVTNATWSDFWLNEGFTTYFENRIMEALYGTDRAEMLQVLGRQELLALLDELKDKPGDQVLHIDLSGRDPDEGATLVPYEKGAAFLRMVESMVGRERFDAWLRGYFERHAFTSLTTDEFLADFREHLLRGDAGLESRMQLQEWIEKPGLPANAPVPHSKAFDRVDEQVRRFAEGAEAATLATSGWTTQEWQRFLSKMPAALTVTQMARLDAAFHFTASGNSEILFTWLRLAIARHYRPALPALERFLTSQGRRKFLTPLYKDLLATSWGKEEAKRIYQRARPLYHSVAIGTLDPLLGVSPKGSASGK